MTEEQKLINVQIGKRLQTVRENMGYTQEAFAEVLSVTLSEAGEGTIRIKHR